MFRPHANGKVSANNNAANNYSNINTKQATSNNNNNENSSTTSNNSSTTTIREIKSRTVGSTTVNNINNNGRNLLANRRQAMSMERLNNGIGSTTSSAGTSINDKGKSSPSSGSSNSINGSPQRAGCLNRTASRVSRFRSAKAVFERLSNNNINNNASNKPPEKPRGTVASRYAAAAAARATSHNNNNTSSPRSRAAQASLARSHDSGKSASNIEIHRVTSNNTNTNNHQQQSPKSELHQPKPQPRVNSSRTANLNTSNYGTTQQNVMMINTTLNDKTKSLNLVPTSTANKANAQSSKLPAQDLIDKIVLEIASDAFKNKPDPDCTIQDLSNCDISGIPETLDFDRCFQDVEMMTEEEARKLLSKKYDSPIKSSDKIDVSSTTTNASACKDPIDNTKPTSQSIINIKEEIKDQVDTSSEFLSKKFNSDKENPVEPISVPVQDLSSTICSNISATSSTSTIKSKVRFSEEPAQICVTHAVEDYDRRNKDIDPVAASAEYELEKSKERDGIVEDDDDDDNNNNISLYSTADNANVAVNGFIEQQKSENQTITCDGNNPHGILIVRSPQNVPQTDDSCDPLETTNGKQKGKNSSESDVNNQDDEIDNKEYIQSLEREFGLKRILEQNLRDLQSQYYEAVKELDDYKSTSEIKITELEQTINELSGKLESSKNELSDSNEKSNLFEKQLVDIKESSQILERKYHRAKRIIKDMQSREQSFNRREQLYQQKLDEIEYELGILIESIFKTIHEDNGEFINLIDNTKAHLDDFSLMKQILKNFNNNQLTQNPQIKQRVLSILEQQLTNLMIQTNGNKPIFQTKLNSNTSSGIVTSTSLSTSISAAANNLSSDNNNSVDQQNNHLIDSNNQHSQISNLHQLASHRLSQPNLPHPIGVGLQATKLLHGINTMPITMPQPSNEPSPPQSVNSYPSTNSLNSLNNNNNNNNNHITTNNNNNILFQTKLRDHQHQLINNDLSNQVLTNSSNTTSTGIIGGVSGAGAIINKPLSLNSSSTMIDEKFQPIPDIQVPYQTNEWHDKPVCEWTTTQVSTWLLALGLDQYISKFEDRNVNGQSLINLDSTVLKGLGVLNSNDRNLLKKKIRELRVEMEKERKLIEKKIKENLKDKSKNKQTNGGNRNENKNDQNKPSWKRGLLS